MIPNPIHKALLIVKNSNARFLVMGGQACILYGAAEFSRDLDLAVDLAAENAKALQRVLEQLRAEQVYVPGFDLAALERGHACHFRCRAPGLENLRIDLMAKLRGCPGFAELWERCTLAELPEIGAIGVISLPDLVRAKKTQRDKDWFMIRRLLEADYLRSRNQPTRAQIEFWLCESRTPSHLVELAKKYPAVCRSLLNRRGLLRAALQSDIPGIETGLQEEEKKEKEADRLYWAPLRAELTQWRRQTRKQK